MAKNQATHNGICQLCGRLQAVTSSGLAKHGYKVKHSYFYGTCGGSGELPLQLSREVLDRTVAHWQQDAERMVTDAALIEIGSKRITHVVIHYYGTSAWDPNRGDKLLTRDEAAALNKRASDRYDQRWDEAAKARPYGLRREAEMIRKHCADMLALADRTTGTELIARKGVAA